MVYTIKNGLKKAYLAPMKTATTWDQLFELGDLVEYAFETAENKSEQPAGNMVVYSFIGKGSSSGTITVPAISDEIFAKIYNTKKNANGDVLYGMDSISGNFCLVIGVTGKATDTGLEKTEYIVLPKTTFGSPSESGQTKSADGTETLQTQQISYTSTALDNGIYKAKTSTLPESITIEMFTPVTQ